MGTCVFVRCLNALTLPFWVVYSPFFPSLALSFSPSLHFACYLVVRVLLHVIDSFHQLWLVVCVWTVKRMCHNFLFGGWTLCVRIFHIKSYYIYILVHALALYFSRYIRVCRYLIVLYRMRINGVSISISFSFSLSLCSFHRFAPIASEQRVKPTDL